MPLMFSFPSPFLHSGWFQLRLQFL
uniref:Uncharacterized protein n=1 Tax=Rhizophora mucronata TaxID=61149 RepID=A0A2P2R146_RHIMU